jgi:hypothetical protein
LHKGYDFVGKKEPKKGTARLTGEQMAINQKIISKENQNNRKRITTWSQGGTLRSTG